ncbi:MAG: response regulator [Desulfobacterales bacterium]|jgi:DNA-binding response OmpR family regulator
MSEKVLIVDDEKDFLEIMAERMRTRGMDVLTATSAEEALKMVEKESYDAVIMDFMMPAIDGFQALKLFKEKKPELQIILLTGNVPEQKRVEAKKLGALDVIEKPADLKVLIGKIKNAKSRRTVGRKKSPRKN